MTVDLTSTQADEATVISISGSIDALTAAQVSSYLDRELNNGKVHLVVDLENVEFMSSAGLRAVLGSLKKSRQLGGDLRLAAAQRGVARVLKMSGFTSILKSYSSVDDAVIDFES
jgi:anti-sigma B factor antagonist